MPTTTTPLPLLLTQVEVARVERLSPSFVRVHLVGGELSEFGVDGPLYDQRIKLIFPGAAGLPSVEGITEDDMAAWYERPEEERGYMRTYTVRAVNGSGAETQLVVDFVLHPPGEPAGPGGAWGARAQVGDRIVLMAPRRGVFFGGIEFDPADAQQILIAADETALPAVARILEDLPPDAQGSAFVEVPLVDDVQDLPRPDGLSLTWLPRDGAARGEAIRTAVLDLLDAGAVAPAIGEVTEVDPDLWETPTYSSSGEDVAAHVRSVGHDYDGLYAWIAGESKVVTGLRRALVKELGIDRRQVCFMGYWRVGVAMKS